MKPPPAGMKESTAHSNGEMLIPRRGMKCLFLTDSDAQPRQRLHTRHNLGYTCCSPVRAQNNCREDGKNEYQQTVDSLTGYRTFWEIKSLGTRSMYKEKCSGKSGRSLEGRADVNHALVAVAEGRP